MTPDPSLVTVTDVARNQIVRLLERESRKDLALRFSVDGRGPGGFRYRLGFMPLDERRPEDRSYDVGGFDVVVDSESVPHVGGSVIDYVDELTGSGFRIDNPNSPWTDPIGARVQELLDREINPVIASHSGHVTLVDVKDGIAYITMGGGCQGCGMADVTLRQGIEQRIKEAVPEIREIVDTTDHARGANPYYPSAEPTPGEGSPLA